MLDSAPLAKLACSPPTLCNQSADETATQDRRGRAYRVSENGITRSRSSRAPLTATIRSHRLPPWHAMHSRLNSHSGSQGRLGGCRGRARGGWPPARAARRGSNCRPGGHDRRQLLAAPRDRLPLRGRTSAERRDTTPTHSPTYRTIPRHSDASDRPRAFHCCLLELYQAMASILAA